MIIEIKGGSSITLFTYDNLGYQMSKMTCGMHIWIGKCVLFAMMGSVATQEKNFALILVNMDLGIRGTVIPFEKTGSVKTRKTYQHSGHVRENPTNTRTEASWSLIDACFC